MTWQKNNVCISINQADTDLMDSKKENVLGEKALKLKGRAGSVRQNESAES